MINVIRVMVQSAMKVFHQGTEDSFHLVHYYYYSFSISFSIHFSSICLIIGYGIFLRFGKNNNKGDGNSHRQRLEETDIDGWLMRFPSVLIAHMLEWLIMISEAQERKLQITVIFLSLVDFLK